MRRFLSNLGIEGWVFGLSGLAAFIFSIVSFLGFAPPVEQTTQIVIGAIGILMLATVAQNARRHADFQDLKDAVGISSTQLVNRGDEFGQHIALTLSRTRQFVSDTYLTSTIPRSTSDYGFSGPQAEYHRQLYLKVRHSQIIFRYVTAVFHKQWLEDILFKLMLHEGYRYYIRHYEPAQRPIPILNIMSFDDESFYLGGFHIRGSAGDDHTLFVRDQNVSQFLKGYWRVLWENGTPLNEGGIIDWSELKKVAERIGIQEDEFEAIVTRAKEAAQKKRRQLERH